MKRNRMKYKKHYRMEIILVKYMANSKLGIEGNLLKLIKNIKRPTVFAYR